MKFDLTKSVLDLVGKPIVNEKDEPVTYRDIISIPLQSGDQREPDTAESKSRAFGILTKIFSSKEVDLTATEIAFILEKTGKFASVMAYGRIKELLEPEEKTAEK